MSESAKKLNNQLIAKIANESARKFWQENFEGVLEIEVSTFLKKIDVLIQYTKKKNKDRAPVFEAAIKEYLCDRAKDMKTIVTYGLYRRFFDNEDNIKKTVEELMSKIINIESSEDNDTIKELNGRIFEEYNTEKEAVEFWNEKINAFKIKKETFKERIFEKFNKSGWTENDKKIISEKLDETFKNEEIKTQEYSQFFKNIEMKDKFAGFLKEYKTDEPKGKEPQIHWDIKKKGTSIMSRDLKSFLINDTVFQYIFSEEKFEKGIHYVEVQLKQIVDGEVFVGCCTPDYEPEIGSRPRSDGELWVVGSQHFCAKSSQIFDDKKIEARQEMIFGILIDLEEKVLDIYVDNKKIVHNEGISKALHVVVSANNKFKYNDGVLLTNCYYREFTKISEFEEYLKGDNVITQFQYTSGAFIESKGVEEDIFWDNNPKNLGKGIKVRDSRKTLETDKDHAYSTALSETTFTKDDKMCNVHYIEFKLIDFDGYIGIARNDEEAITDFNNDLSIKDKVWVLGRTTKCNKELGKIDTPYGSLEIENGYLGLVIDFSNESPTLTYITESGVIRAFKDFPLSVKLVACLTDKTSVHITAYRNREGDYTRLLRQKPVFQTFNFKKTPAHEDLYFGNTNRRIMNKKRGQKNFATKVMKGSDKFFMKVRTKTSHGRFYIGVVAHMFKFWSSPLDYSLSTNPSSVDGLVINGLKTHFSKENNPKLFTFTPNQEEEFVLSIYLREGAMIIYKTGTDQYFYTSFKRLAGFSEKDGVRFVVSMVEEGDYCEIVEFYENPSDHFMFKPLSNKDAKIEGNTLSLNAPSPSVFLGHNVFLESKVNEFDEQFLFYIHTESKNAGDIKVGFKGTQNIALNCGDTDKGSMFLYFTPKKLNAIQTYKKKIENDTKLGKQEIFLNFFVEPKNEGDKIKVLMTNLNNRFQTSTRTNYQDTIQLKGNQVELKVSKEGGFIYAYPYTPLPGIKTLFILKFTDVKKHGLFGLKSKFNLGFTSNVPKDQLTGIYESTLFESNKHVSNTYVGLLLDNDDRCFYVISKGSVSDKQQFSDKIKVLENLKLTIAVTGHDATITLEQTYFTHLDQKTVAERMKKALSSGGASNNNSNDTLTEENIVFLK